MLDIKEEYICAFDNGVSSNGVALLGPNITKYEKLPVKKEHSYTKEEQNITRIDAPKLLALLTSWNLPKDNTLVLMERPMVNPRRFKATLSAIRCLEAELIVIEQCGFKIRYIDSRVWQHAMLPNITGSDELKKASLELGKKLFPDLDLKKDADSLLMAYFAKYGSVKPKKTL